jgi:acetolactate synthase regulatory subunit
MEKKQQTFIAPYELSPGLHRVRIEGTEVQPNRVNVIFTVLGPSELSYLNHQTMARFTTAGAGSLHGIETLLTMVSITTGVEHRELDERVLQMLEEKVFQGMQISVRVVETSSGWTEFEFQPEPRERHVEPLFAELTKLWDKLSTRERIVVLAKANELAYPA